LNASGFKEDKKLNKEIDNKFGIDEELKLDDMIFTLCKGNINKKKYVMKNYSLVEAIKWLSFKSRNSAIERWYLERDTGGSKGNKKEESVKFLSAEEAKNFMEKNAGNNSYI